MAWHTAIKSPLILFLVCLHSEDKLKNQEGGGEGGCSSADTLSHIHPTAANAWRPLYSDWKSNKQIIDLKMTLHQTL